jgi:signal transduction histidine kinase
VIDVGVALLAFALTVALLLVGGAGPTEERRDADALAVALAALASLPLVARRRSPFAVYVVVTLASLAIAALGYPGGPPFGPMIALYFLAAAGPAARPSARVTVSVILSLFALHFLAFGLARDVFPGVELVLGSALWAAAWFAGDRTRLRRERIAELEERARRAELEAERERRLAAAEERMRIARDLHDSAGHAINVILVQAGAARLLADKDPERARQALETIEAVARDTLTEIDRLVHVLREARGEDENGAVEPLAGLAALESLAERHRDAGLGVAVDVVGQRRPLPPAVDQAAYRIVQEALTNALRHGSDTAHVALTYAVDALEIDVTNPVVDTAAATSRGGHGLIGMRERALLLGGGFDARRDDGAFRVRARLPYRGSDGA